MSEKTPFEHINNPGFFVTGIAVKTTNQNGQSEKRHRQFVDEVYV